MTLDRFGRGRGVGAVVCAVAGLGLCAWTSAGQPGRPPRGTQPTAPSTPAPSTPAPSAPSTPGPSTTQPSSPTTEEGPKLGPYVTAGREREWTLTARVGIQAYQDPGVVRRPGSNQPDQMPTIDRWNFETLTVVWPMVGSTGSSEIAIPQERGRAPSLSNYKFTVEDRDATALPEFRTELVTRQAGGRMYHSGVWLAMFKLGRAIRAREVGFEVVIPSRSWETRFDEASARNVGWPTGSWPEEAASTLAPMMFVDFSPTDGAALNQQPVLDLLRQWTEGQDPKSIPPAVLAKWLAGKVAEHVQTSGLGLTANRQGLLEGVSLQQPALTATSGRGSEFDLCVLLVSVYRHAGLPARLVIGYDTQASRRDEPGFLQPGTGGSGELRGWVEFCLYDEARNTMNWVPVDIVKIRKLSSRLPRDFMDVGKLRYFGTHDELDDVVPFAFHFFPPTTVRSYGSPGFWGWFVTPEAPDRAWQTISIRASSTPRRGR